MENGEAAPRAEWRNTIAKKRQQQADLINAFRDLTAQQGDEDVTGIDDIAILVKKIASGELKSEDVVKSYIAKAIEAHEKTNCLTEVLFEDAISRARALDKALSASGKTVGPLHGIPITLKDQFNVTGFDSTIGYTARAFKPASSDAVLVTMLRDLGAIVIAKTNLPQSIMWCETENPLWGLTTNPMNPDYTPGGSTGGESALLSMHGSTVGWGTDIGGSIRIPSHMMGLYGLKPTSARLPYHGVPVSTEGQEHVYSSVGPLSRSLSSLHYIFKEVVLAEPWNQDGQCPPMPWKEDVYTETLSKKLTVGVLLDDGVVEPHPCITRVVQAVADLLKNDGHDIVPWNSDMHVHCIDLMDAYYTADGGEDIRREVEAGGEPFIPHVEKLVNRGEPISVFEYWQLNKLKKSLRQGYFKKWKKLTSPSTGKEADVVIMPVMPHPAVPHKACRWVGYTKVWNFLDYSAMSMPAGTVEAQDCEVPMSGEPRNEMDEWNRKVWKEHGQDMAKMKLPIGVQIISRTYKEEKVLAVAQVIEKLLKK